MSAQEKAELNFCKFIENTCRIIGKTNQIINRILEENRDNREIQTKYSEVPDLLKIASDLLTNCGVDAQKSFMSSFILKSVNIWELIRLKDDRVLTEHLSEIMPGNGYVENIQYVYGANSSRKCFVNSDEIGVIWKLITAVIHNSIKYIIFSGDSTFVDVLPRDVVKLWKVQLN